MKKYVITMACLSFLFSAVFIPSGKAHAKKKKLSTQQIQVLQTKDFDASCPATFRAVLGSLQDNNFQLKDADQKAGFVYAQTGGKRSFMMGTVKNVDGSITFDDSSKNRCRVRANFFEVVSKKSAGFLSVLTTVTALSTGTYTGTGIEPGYEQAKLVTDSGVYERFYTAVQKHLFVKEALSR
ncbi:MAG: hypothetical protein HYU99_06875 [Deltaproteobacteria bacterium]|nr:hypothetical protein [Deltaproteobacteria bacterium]